MISIIFDKLFNRSVKGWLRCISQHPDRRKWTCNTNSDTAGPKQLGDRYTHICLACAFQKLKAFNSDPFLKINICFSGAASRQAGATGHKCQKGRLKPAKRLYHDRLSAAWMHHSGSGFAVRVERDGSSLTSNQFIAQCRCGPVARPVAPMRPIIWPRRT